MKQVLEAYEKALEVCKDLGLEKAYEYLWKNNLEHGICFYCNMNKIEFDTEIRGYIFTTPDDCKNHSEIIESLEFRINFLKQLP
jgi:hypothetical protein